MVQHTQFCHPILTGQQGQTLFNLSRQEMENKRSSTRLKGNVLLEKDMTRAPGCSSEGTGCAVEPGYTRADILALNSFRFLKQASKRSLPALPAGANASVRSTSQQS